MACHLAGVTTAVATCGTAFGVDHIKVIRRVLGDVDNTDSHGLGEVIFTFDPDEAGQKAASRAFAEEQRFAAQTFVAVAPDGLDPCDLRLQRGDDAVSRLVDERKPMFEFMIRRVLGGFDLETVEGRVGALRAAAPVVAGIRDPALHSGYIRNLAGWIGLDPQEVSRAVKSAAGQRAAGSRAAEQAASGDRRGDGASAGTGQDGDAARTPGPSITQLPTDPVTRLERDALMAVLQQPEAVGRERAQRMTSAAFSNPTLAVVRDGVAASMDSFDSPRWLDRVAEEVPAMFAGVVSELGIAPIPAKDDRELSIYCQGVVASLIGRDLLASKAELLGRLQRTDAAAEPERYRELQRELMRVEADRRELIPE
jgi:DNA primase